MAPLILLHVKGYSSRYCCWLQKKCVASAISSVGEENEVFSFCLDGEGVACAAVEGALPPGGEVVDGVGEASGL